MIKWTTEGSPEFLVWRNVQTYVSCQGSVGSQLSVILMTICRSLKIELRWHRGYPSLTSCQKFWADFFVGGNYGETMAIPFKLLRLNLKG